ncbi:MAG: hypothetical protein ACYTCU_06010, partial [Planctomycetota bacterium]
MSDNGKEASAVARVAGAVRGVGRLFSRKVAPAAGSSISSVAGAATSGLSTVAKKSRLLTLRARLALCLLAILLMVGSNVAIGYWSNEQRDESVDALSRAVDRGLIIAAMRTDLDDFATKGRLIETFVVDQGVSVDEELVEDIRDRVVAMTGRVEEVRGLTDEEDLPGLDALVAAIAALPTAYDKLADGIDGEFNTLLA